MTTDNSKISLNSKLIIFFVIAAIMITGILISFDTIEINGDSMVPTLSDGDTVVVWSLPYLPGMPDENLDYGDIIVISAPDSMDNVLMIKRIIGLEHDVITIENGLVYRNGFPLQEQYVNGMTLPLNLQADEEKMPEWDMDYSYTVPANHVYILGDNRLLSSDSREYGALPRKNIIGRMIFP
ncbi:signal peptidase I [Gudongella sp. DL1XJH-153]|uniref:signal peptidase I n=1 Tax=Gudongella sp. DL1XJH-153 TaxID=3409804 RepID=UPI003BB5DAB2